MPQCSSLGHRRALDKLVSIFFFIEVEYSSIAVLQPKTLRPSDPPCCKTDKTNVAFQLRRLEPKGPSSRRTTKFLRYGFMIPSLLFSGKNNN